jgi:hypothetical protein
MADKMNRWGLIVFALLLALLSLPPQWYPLAVRVQLGDWFGAADFRPLPESKQERIAEAEIFCPPDPSGWRNAVVIEGVQIRQSPACIADNPALVAAVVRGTNNVSNATLLNSGLAANAVEKGKDIDGDGDPDEIHIRLEVVELNGASAMADGPVTRYSIAPGIEPGVWVFAPKLVGMAVENMESGRARPELRLPSPAIRIEQGDRVRITLENTHYMPHTLHLHGADHGFVDADGEGNDGVPLTSELPVLPGETRTYELKPRSAGTMFYHCHVQPHVHVQMGLQGLFIIEENRPDNWLQTLNVGAGLVRTQSSATGERYSDEYDLHYQDFDLQLGERIRQYQDPRLVTRAMHRDYDITDARPDYFTLNGKSFPYTFRESLIVARTEADKPVRLRALNGGAKGIALHTHGHKFRVTHKDGVAREAPALEDTYWLATAERADLELSFDNDGVHAYGPGIWPFHDHQPAGITTDGIGPGGNISAIVYASYLGADGWPMTQGVDWSNFFSADYYRKAVPVWRSYAPELFGDVTSDTLLVLRALVFWFAIGMLLALSMLSVFRR